MVSDRPAIETAPMLLYRSAASSTPAKASVGRVWSASTLVDAAPSDVLEALTDPALIARWSPVDFDLERLDRGRLRAGTSARITGGIAGLRAGFDVEVLRADENGLELRASGPVDMEVAYRIADSAEGTTVRASIELRRRGGVSAQLLRAATTALLNEGALDSALGRLAGALSPSGAGELVAA